MRSAPNSRAYRGKLFKDQFLDRVEAFRDVPDLLRAIRTKGRKIALASSAKSDELKIYKKIAGIEKLTDVETSSDDAEKSKPHPDIFQAALKKLKLKPDQVLVIGDTPYDADAAGKAGVASIGVLCGGFTEEAIRAGGASRIYRDPQDSAGPHRGMAALRSRAGQFCFGRFLGVEKRNEISGRAADS